jgi:hypothetical protein
LKIFLKLHAVKIPGNFIENNDFTLLNNLKVYFAFHSIYDDDDTMYIDSSLTLYTRNLNENNSVTLKCILWAENSARERIEDGDNGMISLNNNYIF